MDVNSGCIGIVVVQVLKDGKASASGVMVNERMNQLLRGNTFRSDGANIDICIM
jgi:hypothetical protein